MPIKKHVPRRDKRRNDNFRSDDHFFQQLIESLEEYVIFTTDKAGFVNSWNSGAQKIFGYKEKEILGRNAEIFFIPEDIKAKKPEKELHISRTEGKAVNERWHVRKDGSRFWGSGLVFPLKDDHGNIRGFTKVMRDLTERREGILKLKQSQERYRAFVMNSSEGIWRMELEKPMKIAMNKNKQIDHLYQYYYLAECNDSLARMYGYRASDELIGKRLEFFLPRKNKGSVEHLTLFLDENFRVTEAESTEKDKNGNVKYFLNSLVGSVKDGYLYRTWGMQRDITAQKEMMASQAQLASIVESSDDAIVSRQLDGTVLSWNKGAEKVYGFTAKEMIGKNVFSLIPTERDDEIKHITEQMKKGKYLHHFETTRLRKDGSEIDVSISLSPIKNEAGEVIGVSTIARDITERKKLQQQKDDFIAIASHELKTPVTSIKAYAQVLEKRFAKKGSKTSSNLLAKMDSQIDKLTNLISDLLDVSKIESGKLQLNYGTFNFNDLAKEVVEEMQRTTQRHTLITDLAKSKTIVGDRDRIGQVMINLISNAIKYSPNAEKVIITTKYDQNNVTLSVQDFGVGIPKNKLDHIFERFFRVSGPQQNTFPGMGLGLYISSEIIKRQGGRIWVESHYGKGSKFCFMLPLNKKTASKKKTSPRMAQRLEFPQSPHQ